MELQLALLALGLIIVAVIALTAYDRVRIAKAFKAARDSARKLKARTSHRGGLDIESRPPQETNKRILDANAPVAAPIAAGPEAEFYQELQDFEHAAVMPLNLGLQLHPDEAGGAPEQLPDEHIDFVVTLPGAGPVERNRALGIFKQNEYLLEKPRRLFGLRHRTGIWSELERDPESMQYSHLQIALQLVDLKGPAGESELTTFSQVTLKLADALARPTKFNMTFEQALERAQSLNRFCETYDVFANVNIVANSPNGFNGRAVERAALRKGMEFGAQNIFHLKDARNPGNRHLFSLANMFQPGQFNLRTLDTTPVHGLTLFMSVPCVMNPVRVFEKMVETGSALCELLDGKMLDHDRRPLTAQGIAAIRQQIGQIAEGMQSQGVVPGSASALRLFHNP